MGPPACFWRSATRALPSDTIRIVAAFIAPNCAHASPLPSRYGPADNASHVM